MTPSSLTSSDHGPQTLFDIVRFEGSVQCLGKPLRWQEVIYMTCWATWTETRTRAGNSASKPQWIKYKQHNREYIPSGPGSDLLLWPYGAISLQTHAHVHTCTCTHILTCMHTRTHMCTHARAHTVACTRTHAHTRITQTHTHARSRTRLIPASQGNVLRGLRAFPPARRGAWDPGDQQRPRPFSAQQTRPGPVLGSA